MSTREENCELCQAMDTVFAVMSIPLDVSVASWGVMIDTSRCVVPPISMDEVWTVPTKWEHIEIRFHDRRNHNETP